MNVEKLYFIIKYGSGKWHSEWVCHLAQKASKDMEFANHSHSKPDQILMSLGNLKAYKKAFIIKK